MLLAWKNTQALDNADRLGNSIAQLEDPDEDELQLYRSGLAGSYLVYDHIRAASSDSDAADDLVARVRRNVSANGKIFVLDYDASVYVRSRRRCAAPFTYPRTPQHENDILKCLEDRQADLVLRPVDRPQWALHDADNQQRLERLLESYRMTGVAGRYELFVRPQREQLGETVAEQ